MKRISPAPIRNPLFKAIRNVFVEKEGAWRSSHIFLHLVRPKQNQLFRSVGVLQQLHSRDNQRRCAYASGSTYSCTCETVSSSLACCTTRASRVMGRGEEDLELPANYWRHGGFDPTGATHSLTSPRQQIPGRLLKGALECEHPIESVKPTYAPSGGELAACSHNPQGLYVPASWWRRRHARPKMTDYLS